MSSLVRYMWLRMIVAHRHRQARVCRNIEARRLAGGVAAAYRVVSRRRREHIINWPLAVAQAEMLAHLAHIARRPPLIRRKHILTPRNDQRLMSCHDMHTARKESHAAEMRGSAGPENLWYHAVMRLGLTDLALETGEAK